MTIDLRQSSDPRLTQHSFHSSNTHCTLVKGVRRVERTYDGQLGRASLRRRPEKQSNGKVPPSKEEPGCKPAAA